MEQTIIKVTDSYECIDHFLQDRNCRKVMLVCDSSLPFLRINEYFASLTNSNEADVIRFNDFQPNPLYESVEKGVEIFNAEKCDAIIAVGGGSAIDVAKCIKLYSNMTAGTNFLQQEIVPNHIPFLAIPTTAGTGSEATKYAVIYYNDQKQSVTHESCIPDTVVLDSSTLKTLPLYQKKSTMLDALCHSIESFWSVNSTEESKQYSRKAIQLILTNMQGYLNNDDFANQQMQVAAYTAGKAINITQTTAGHAMCYKLTSLFHIAHGHAAALCDQVLFPWMLENVDKCIDQRSTNYVKEVFGEIAESMDCSSPGEAANKISSIVHSLELEKPVATEEQLSILKSSVNPVRLKNHPIELSVDTIEELYRRIVHVS